jgi:flagellar motor protein MotB
MIRVPHRYLWHKPAAQADAPRWAVTYGDMMSLVLCFFVLLAAISEVREGARYRVVAASLRSVFGADDPADRSASLVERLAAKTTAGQAVAVGGSEAPVLTMTHAADGLHATLLGPGAFAAEAPPGDPLTADAVVALQRLGGDVAGMASAIEVCGYAEGPRASDTVAHGRPIAGNEERWEGAFRRARAVARVLAQCGVPADRLQLRAARFAPAVGADGSRPVDDPRRVDVVIQVAGRTRGR